MKIMRKVVQSSKPFFVLLFSIVIAMMAISPPIAYATEESNESKHYLGTVVNAGHDTGFPKTMQSLRMILISGGNLASST